MSASPVSLRKSVITVVYPSGRPHPLYAPGSRAGAPQSGLTHHTIWPSQTVAHAVACSADHGRHPGTSTEDTAYVSCSSVDTCVDQIP